MEATAGSRSPVWAQMDGTPRASTSMRLAWLLPTRKPSTRRQAAMRRQAAIFLLLLIMAHPGWRNQFRVTLLSTISRLTRAIPRSHTPRSINLTPAAAVLARQRAVEDD